MVWHSASLLGPGTDTKAWGGVQAGRRLQHPPPPKGNRLWLHYCGGWDRGSVFGFLAFHLCLGSWLVLSGDLGRGARLVAGGVSMSGPCHPIGFFPALRARSNIKCGPAGAWANRAGQASSRCVQLFSPTPIESLGLGDPCQLLGGSQVPRFQG